jgi:hydroxymethylpyrimidine/phosphomethylpyrimidine kinase
VLDDEGQVTVFRGEWIEAPPVRGTGCMLSAAIAAGLAQGMELTESVKLAKQFVADAIRNAPELAANP